MLLEQTFLKSPTIPLRTQHVVLTDANSLLLNLLSLSTSALLNTTWANCLNGSSGYNGLPNFPDAPFLTTLCCWLKAFRCSLLSWLIRVGGLMYIGGRFMKGSSQTLCLLERRFGVCGVELSVSLVGVGGCISSAEMWCWSYHMRKHSNIVAYTEGRKLLVG